MLASFVNTCFGALDPPRGHRPYSCSSRPEDQGVGAGTPDERDRNRVSVSKSIYHSEFPESTRARASAQGSVHSEPSHCAPIPEHNSRPRPMRLKKAESQKPNAGLRNWGHSLPIPLVSASRDGVLKTASFTQLSPASPDVVFSKLCSTNSDATY
jgi:hypothetical protein